MNQDILKLYRRFRKASPFMLIGYNADQSLTAAKILHNWLGAEASDLVRIRAEAEDEDYFSVFGEPESEHERKRMVEILERQGCWWVVTEYKDPETDKWEHADSIGMNTGYKDPCSPFENCYVVGMMQEALSQLESIEHARYLRTTPFELAIY